MSQKVPCLKCGVLILESTALRTKDLCMPCKGGYRQSIEEGKRRIREERERMRTDPFCRLWVSLVERVYNSPGGFNALSEPEKLYFAVNVLEGDVFNGGFHQYFFDSSGSYYAYAEKGLIALGATQTLDLLQKAKEVLFPETSVPVDTGVRREALLAWNERLDDLDRLLDDLHKLYWANSEDLTPRLQAFARNHGLVS